MTRLVRRAILILSAACLALTALPAHAAEVMCDTSFQDCRTPLLNLIRNETNSIDVAMWFMEDQDLADAIIARFRAGVAVRAIVDPRRNSITPINATTLSKFQSAGIPMRNKTSGGILHWKFMIFNAQNKVQWSAANYSDFYFRPTTPYRDYVDEGIYFSDDLAVLNSFRRKFDDTWVLTTGFANYANISGTPTRAYPLYAIDPDMNFVPAEDFGLRSKPLYDAETQRIDVIMYKITEATHTDAMIRAVRRGVPVRIITEPDRYRSRDNLWQAYHIDRMYAAGVQIRDRAHAGFLHQKSTLLYGQGLTVYGSSNWSTESNRSQYEHNYFTDKAWFFTWFRNNFDRKWGNLTGNVETTPFVPLPPDAPVYVSPANGATGISTTTAATISWKPGPWAHRADVYFGTSSSPPLIASNVSVPPGGTKIYTLPALAQGTTYYWRIVSKTMANRTAAGPTYSFRTSGGTQPPPPPPPSSTLEIVRYAADATQIAGAWRLEADTTAAGGQRVHQPNAGAAKVVTAAAAPANFFEFTFNVEAGRAYRLWIRGKADSNSWANDSAHIQFSGSVNQSGAAVYRIGTTASTEFNLESCTGCGLSGWGWEDNGWGTGVLGPLIYFAATGTQRIRIQTREDGLSIDQVVLSAQRYLNTAPGPNKNDATIVPK